MSKEKLIRSTKKKSKSQTDWAKLRQRDNTHINYSDIPATTKDFWKDAKVVMPLHKVPVCLRLDDDIIAYFKQQGRGYQSKINAVLKAYVHAHS